MKTVRLHVYVNVRLHTRRTVWKTCCADHQNTTTRNRISLNVRDMAFSRVNSLYARLQREQERERNCASRESGLNSYATTTGTVSLQSITIWMCVRVSPAFRSYVTQKRTACDNVDVRKGLYQRYSYNRNAYYSVRWVRCMRLLFFFVLCESDACANLCICFVCVFYRYNSLSFALYCMEFMTATQNFVQSWATFAYTRCNNKRPAAAASSSSCSLSYTEEHTHTHVASLPIFVLHSP